MKQHGQNHFKPPEYGLRAQPHNRYYDGIGSG